MLQSPSGRHQGFVGALEGQRASKGVFITTSRFTQEARDYARSLLRRVVLIDGDELADLISATALESRCNGPSS